MLYNHKWSSVISRGSDTVRIYDPSILLSLGPLPSVPTPVRTLVVPVSLLSQFSWLPSTRNLSFSFWRHWLSFGRSMTTQVPLERSFNFRKYGPLDQNSYFYTRRLLFPHLLLHLISDSFGLHLSLVSVQFTMCHLTTRQQNNRIKCLLSLFT